MMTAVARYVLGQVRIGPCLCYMAAKKKKVNGIIRKGPSLGAVSIASGTDGCQGIITGKVSGSDCVMVLTVV